MMAIAAKQDRRGAHNLESLGRDGAEIIGFDNRSQLTLVTVFERHDDHGLLAGGNWPSDQIETSPVFNVQGVGPTLVIVFLLSKPTKGDGLRPRRRVRLLAPPYR